MYWAAATDTELGRKKRDADSAGDDGFHGQVGESEKDLDTTNYLPLTISILTH